MDDRVEYGPWKAERVDREVAGQEFRRSAKVVEENCTRICD